jgi:hypothetical protein
VSDVRSATAHDEAEHDLRFADLYVASISH